MNTLDIAIDIESIYTEVMKIAEYKGKKQNEAKGDLSYDLLHISDAEKEMLDTYLHEVTGKLEELLKLYVVPVEQEEGKVKWRCHMPDSWEEKLSKSCIGDIESIMINYIAAKWIRIAKPDIEPDEMATVEAKFADLKSKIYYRGRPRRGRIHCCCEEW